MFVSFGVFPVSSLTLTECSLCFSLFAYFISLFLCLLACLVGGLVGCLFVCFLRPACEHDDLWTLFDGIIASRPSGEVALVKVKAHKSSENATDHFEKLCCHYNALTDADAKEAVKQSRLVSFAQLQALHSKQLQINKMVSRFHSFLAECAALQLKAVQRQSQFETSVLDVRGSCFCHLAVMEASILDFPYTKEFGKTLCEWAQQLLWAEHHEHANTSFAELLVKFIHTARVRPPINIHKFRQGGKYRRPCFRMRAHCACDVPLEAYDFAEDLRTFQAASTWFRKRGVALLPGDVILNIRPLYIIGYSRPTKGVSHRVKHSCPVDPRVTLQEIFMQRPASHWRFDFHVKPEN